jgi:hypothetical protein
MSRKPDLPKSCAYCGGTIPRARYKTGRLEDYRRHIKRMFCSTTCAGKARRNRQSEKCACRNARVDAKLAGLLKSACEECGGCKLLDLHHIDKNRENNAADNVRTLCKSCHAKWHWRHGWKPKPHATCSICGERAKGKGLCQRHFRRFNKYGDPLVTTNRRGGKLQRVSPTYSRNG